MSRRGGKPGPLTHAGLPDRHCRQRAHALLKFYGGNPPGFYCARPAPRRAWLLSRPARLAARGAGLGPADLNGFFHAAVPPLSAVAELASSTATFASLHEQPCVFTRIYPAGFPVSVAAHSAGSAANR